MSLSDERRQAEAENDEILASSASCWSAHARWNKQG
jgi:hypothetical protein